MNLEIDHLFFTVSANEFEKIVSNEEIYKCFRDISTHTSEASYRGLYLTFHDGTYLEILYPHKDFVDGTFGLSLSDLDANDLSVDKMEAPSKIEKKDVFHGDEFWYSLYDCKEPIDERLYVFAMDYSAKDLAKRKSFKERDTFKLKSLVIKSLLSLELLKKETSNFFTNIDCGLVNLVESQDEVVELTFSSSTKTYYLSFGLRT